MKDNNQIQTDDASENKVNNEIEELKKKCEEYLNGWKRAQADYINYKNEEANRVQELRQCANENIIMELLSALDNLDAVIREIPKDIEDKHKEWFAGLYSTVDQFSSLLIKHGVQKIEVYGAKFDPSVHEAISGNDFDAEMIEVRAGYVMSGKVIRPARVMFVKEKEGNDKAFDN